MFPSHDQEEAIERAEVAKKVRHDEVAKEVQERYKNCQPIISHEYLKNKNVKSYGLKKQKKQDVRKKNRKLNHQEGRGNL